MIDEACVPEAKSIIATAYRVQRQRRAAPASLDELTLVSLRSDETGNAPIQAAGPQPLEQAVDSVVGAGRWMTLDSTCGYSHVPSFQALFTRSYTSRASTLADMSSVRAVSSQFFPTTEAIQKVVTLMHDLELGK